MLFCFLTTLSCVTGISIVFFNEEEEGMYASAFELISALLKCSRCTLHAIATGIFEVIVDQSPYAIEDLMKELGSDSDEDNVSEEDKQENEDVLKTKGKEEVLSSLGNTCWNLKIPVLKIDFCSEPVTHMYVVRMIVFSCLPFGCALSDSRRMSQIPVVFIKPDSHHFSASVLDNILLWLLALGCPCF